MTGVREVLVLGSTGSVGRSAVAAVEMLGEGFRAHGLMARGSHDVMLGQAERLRPRLLALTEPGAARQLRAQLDARGIDAQVAEGTAAVEEAIGGRAATDVVVALPGLAGLPLTLLALNSGCRVLLANKESLVTGGPLILRALRTPGAELVPIDSEHNALHQLLGGPRPGQGLPADVRNIILTASGGPFRLLPAAALESVTPEQACNHPVWHMGRKISVDSATLMNKGLEMIEAHWLFGAPPERIRVVIHPQSIVHGIVEYVDGNSAAHMGIPDMRLPIASALAHPRRIGSGLRAPDWGRLGTLDFEKPRDDCFPCLGLAYEAMRRGGGAPATLNAANEVAVGRFLAGEIGFMRIPGVVERTLDSCDHDGGSYEALMATDSAARRIAQEAPV